MILEDNEDSGSFIDKYNTKVLNRILDIIIKTDPSLIFVVSDSGSNKRAISINPEYKANRKRAKTVKEIDKVKNKIELLRRFIKTLPIIFLEHINVEADLIAFALLKYLNSRLDDTKYLLVSSDSDMLQVLNENVCMYSLAKPKEIITIDNFYTIFDNLGNFGILESYCLFKSVIGDTADNIKGIHGIGKKKMSEIFSILGKYNKYHPTNYQEMDEQLSQTIKIISDSDNLEDIKKYKNKLEIFYNLFMENKQKVKNNQRIIDFNELESPYIIDIFSSIKQSINDGVKLQTKNLQKILNITGLENSSNNNDALYIRRKFNQNIYYLKDLERRSNQFIEDYIK
jgi:5'-3' exonuclease